MLVARYPRPRDGPIIRRDEADRGRVALLRRDANALGAGDEGPGVNRIGPALVAAHLPACYAITRETDDANHFLQEDAPERIGLCIEEFLEADL